MRSPSNASEAVWKPEREGNMSKQKTLWAYLDGEKMIDVVQAAKDNNISVTQMKGYCETDGNFGAERDEHSSLSAGFPKKHLTNSCRVFFCGFLQESSPIYRNTCSVPCQNSTRKNCKISAKKKYSFSVILRRF